MNIPPRTAASLVRPTYPRSAGYDPAWMLENWMGPNALWLMEALTDTMELVPGMRVLDLGPGRAISSIFLAREFGVQVIAADLWVDPGENWQRIKAAGVEGQVLPLRAEAHDLPFAADFFDAIVSVDAYHYFGTDELYLGQLVSYLRPGGQIGVVVPGLTSEIGEEPPPWLEPLWDPEFFTFHAPEWWERLWRRSGSVEVIRADLIPEGWRDWLAWSEVCVEVGAGDPDGADAAWELKMLQADQGRTLGFSRIVARRSHPG